MRIVTIEHPGEVHVHDYQLVVEQETGTASILVEQVELLVTCQRRWSFPWWQTPAWLASRPRR